MRHGFLLVDKPRGPTSHDIVADVRRALNESKVGHAGTLDPMATGLLVLAVGAKALKVLEFFLGLRKSYELAVRFGAVSTTYDADGEVRTVDTKPGWQEPTREDVERALRDRFLGKISQVPPAHSAVHVGGKRAYELAREGKPVEIPARTVEIGRCDVLAYAYPSLTLDVECSSGAYMRSLAHDLGHLLRCGAYLEGLRRTTVGEWKVADAVLPDHVAWARVIPLKDTLRHLPAVEITADEMEDLRCGRRIRRAVTGDTFAWLDGLPVAVLTPIDPLIAHPRKVL